MNFGDALEAIKSGKKAHRDGWNGSRNGDHLKLQRPDEHSKMTQPYIYCEYEENGKINLAPWMPLQADILAEDWEVEA